MRDLLSGMVLMLLGGISFLLLIPYGVQQMGEAPNVALSATFWPYVIVTLFTVLALGLFLQGGWALLKDKRQVVKGKTVFPVGMLCAVLLLVPYYLLATTVGLLLASMFAFAAYALLAGERNYMGLICLAVIVPVAITLFFIHVAQVLVPLGPLKTLFS